jgi:glycosyltransferase involved in cell wall biosynthesis
MRVLQLVPSLEVGGLEVMVLRLSEALCRAGVEVHLGELTHRGALASEAVFRGRWVGGLRTERGVRDWRCHLSLWRHLVRNRFSVVHVHNIKACSYALFASVLSRTPVVYTVHGRGQGAYAFENGMRRVNRAGIWFVHAYVAVSRDVQDRLVRIDGVPASKVVVVRNGIDAQAFRRPDPENAEAKRVERRRLGIPETAFVVGSAGRFCLEKNYPLLVRAFAGLVAGGGREFSASVLPFLVLLGDGPEKAAIEEAVRTRGLGDRCLLPGVQKDLKPWLRAMDAFCLSSDTEGVPAVDGEPRREIGHGPTRGRTDRSGVFHETHGGRVPAAL